MKHHSLNFALVLLLGGAAACAGTEQSSATGHGPGGKADDGSGADGDECVVDTIQMTDAVELATDLEAAFDPSFVVDPGSDSLPHVRVPGALDAVLNDTDEFGAYVYTFHGWDVVPQDLVIDYPFAQGTGLFASIGGAPASETTTFEKARSAVAESIFNAMTGVQETRVEYEAPASSYETSFTRLRRGTEHGRLVCDMTTFPNTGQTTYQCVFSNVRWKTAQAASPEDLGGDCLSP